MTFFLYRRCFKLRILENITDDVHGSRHVFAEAPCVVNRLLARGERIQVSTEVLNLEFQRMLASSAGPLERHVLKEMGGSIGFIRFCAGASVDPHTNSGGMSMRMRLCCDCQTVGKSRDLRSWCGSVDG